MWKFFSAAVPFLVGLTLVGCGPSEEQNKLEFAKSTVQRALDAWKNGETPTQLANATDPIEFYDDDWQQSGRLLDYEIRQLYMNSDGTARCAVTLQVQYGNRSPMEVKCIYQVVADPRVRAARDPMG